MTTTEGILATGLALNIAGNLWMLFNHRYSAKAERVELFKRMRKVEGHIIAIKTRLGMKTEDEET